MNKTYLGDSVYIKPDASGFYPGGFVLTTENGMGYASNTIYLDPEVTHSLIRYITNARHDLNPTENELH